MKESSGSVLVQVNEQLKSACDELLDVKAKAIATLHPVFPVHVNVNMRVLKTIEQKIQNSMLFVAGNNKSIILI